MQHGALAPAAHALARIAGGTAAAARMRQTFRRQQASWRLLSNAPEIAVYGGGGGGASRPHQQQQGAAPPPARPVTLATLRGKHRRGEPVTMVTAYDYSSAVHVDAAGIDLILVGDSAAMVAHGHDNTLPISLDLMLEHCRAVVRGAPRPLIVGDLPFGSYEASPAQAVESAVRLVKEGGVDVVKMEGGAPSRVNAAKAIVEAGIAVMGHVGLTPQAISVLGGFRAQGKTVDSALKVLEAAVALQDAGCFAVVLFLNEHHSTVLVYHDLLGMFQDPNHSKVTPKFCKQFANVGAVINKALTEYREEVEARSFPDAVYTPYKMSSKDADDFANVLQKMGFDGAAAAAAAAADNAEKLEDRRPQEMNIKNGALSAGAAV